MSYKVEIVERKDPIVQLENLFNDILNEKKGFNYQIAVKILLKNASSMEKLNLDHLILIQQQKQ